MTLRVEPNSKYGRTERGLGVPDDALELSYLSWESLTSLTSILSKPLFPRSLLLIAKYSF